MMAEGDDPAERVVKTLVVDYEIEGRPFRVRGQDPTTIHLSREAVNITVEKARYGVLDDPKRTRDVREKVQRLADAGASSFKVALMAQGDDPAFLVVKTLELEYAKDGQRVRLTGTDPDTLYLAPGVIPAPPVARVQCDARGRVWLEAREPGEYELASASGKSQRANVATVFPPLEVDGPWQVRFAPGRGAPAEATFDRLVSWSDHSDAGVKFFSGEATYLKRLDIPRERLDKNQRLYLDLGIVAALARMTLNGKDLGTLWKPPFVVDISDTAKAGANTLEVRVVSLWPNRMIGDEHLPEDSERNPDGTLKKWPAWLLEGKPSPTGRFTFTSWRLWKKNDPLLPSGLLGPVTLRSTQLVPVRVL
jgi:hypothetical protein